MRIGDSGCSGSHARLIKPATGGTILSGRRRTGDRPEKISECISLAPQDEIENNAPQRVQTTVLPPRVARQDPGQTSLQHIIPSQSTPNSHRRQQTPRRRIVTPQTPHVMVRRSARQQNVSQDMMAKTIAQANHCFSISAQTKYTHPSSTNTDIVILPKMANAVICPETVKYLKHQELITKLKYKIKWMRSTANEINRL
jgi:hypothetical protein